MICSSIHSGREIYLGFWSSTELEYSAWIFPSTPHPGASIFWWAWLYAWVRWWSNRWVCWQGTIRYLPRGCRGRGNDWDFWWCPCWWPWEWVPWGRDQSWVWRFVWSSRFPWSLWNDCLISAPTSPERISSIWKNYIIIQHNHHFIDLISILLYLLRRVDSTPVLVSLLRLFIAMVRLHLLKYFRFRDWSLAVHLISKHWRGS